MQRFLDYADEQVDRAVRAKRKGALAAYRDATLFKVMYRWGLRRTETSKLDLTDWGRNPNSAGTPDDLNFATLSPRVLYITSCAFVRSASKVFAYEGTEGNRWRLRLVFVRF